ncbi:MAG: hypothetical protein HEQ37_15350 [Acidovorax sp.]|jgi:predicted anti-sigma-YlaC factor YlaD|uniref:anti-sigma factor family protein n=1 Tax=Acidovorax sp. TaxID=1872122 RepID=UPI0025C6288B|nr:hypothetical protein [Acidovorax sp.]MCO4094853.1 hypothetical protein [Acidovorax sp.]MDH4425738.1 hypothetical protein [Acidovorax sp.]MDH4446194.1 hypothetical protein [Acidovorax sp.]MDH4462807.1 hypothetical protein [Acidovorax sp.]
MLNCKSATGLVSQAQESPLSMTQKVRLNVHLMMCASCRHFSQQIPFLSQLMRAHAQGEDEKARR